MDRLGSFREVLRRCCVSSASRRSYTTRRPPSKPRRSAAVHEWHRAPIPRTPGFAESSGGGVLRPRCCLAGAVASVPLPQSACVRHADHCLGGIAPIAMHAERRTPPPLPLFCDRLMVLSAAADTCAELIGGPNVSRRTEAHHLTLVQYGESMCGIAWIHRILSSAKRVMHSDLRPPPTALPQWTPQWQAV